MVGFPGGVFDSTSLSDKIQFYSFLWINLPSLEAGRIDTPLFIPSLIRPFIRLFEYLFGVFYIHDFAYYDRQQ